MKKLISVLVLLALCGNGWAQEPVKRKCHKWTGILTAVGIGGGSALGLVYGLGAYDDAVNSERKVTMSAVLFGIAGGVGGFLLGRHIDKKSETELPLGTIRWPAHPAPELDLTVPSLSEQVQTWGKPDRTLVSTLATAVSSGD